MKLNGKRILFIAPSFFGYEEKITEKMIELGATVDFFDERSIKSPFEKSLLKINPLIFYKKTINYYNQIIDGISNIEYDFILIIKCEMMPVEIIKQLKSKFSKASLCLYLYDSLNNIKGILTKLDYFDRILSFDMDDTNRYSNIIFRPLFFIDDYMKSFEYQKQYDFDISFVGTVHSDRYKVIKAIKDIAEKRNYKYFSYCYLQSKFMYYFYRISKREFKSARIADFEFVKIDSKKISEIIEKTNVVLDVQHPNQTGLTIRTIEMIGMHKKIITTNQSIKEYDFYNPDNISVIDRNNVVIPDGFLDKSYIKIEEEIYNKYSLESWLTDVLGVQ